MLGLRHSPPPQKSSCRLVVEVTATFRLRAQTMKSEAKALADAGFGSTLTSLLGAGVLMSTTGDDMT
jgi:hypothetical protein